MFNLAFDSLLLDGDKLVFNYSKAFEVLFNAVSMTNSSKELNISKLPLNIFEPSDLRIKTNKNRAFDPEIASMLRR